MQMNSVNSSDCASVGAGLCVVLITRPEGILPSVVCLWSWSFNKRRSCPTRVCSAMRISSISFAPPFLPHETGTTHFPIHQPLFACITLSSVWQVLSSNALRNIFYKTLRCWSHWCLPVPPTARHNMYEHSSPRTTERRDAVLRKATFHTFYILGRWCYVTYCSWTSILQGVCGSRVADVKFYSYISRCAYCNWNRNEVLAHK